MWRGIRWQRKKKIGLALGSGGARGWAHLGVLRAIEESGGSVHAVAGASMGALVGGFLAASQTAMLTDLALHFDSGRIHVDQWHDMDDEAIIAELVAIRGIGRWTAEMFLMFHLMRPDVLPLDDVGLIKGISLNYFSGEPVSRSEAREVAEAWAPCRTVATWYMWRSLEPTPVAY